MIATTIASIDLRELRSYCLANFPVGSVVREMAATLPDEVPRDEAAGLLVALARVIYRCRPGA